MKKCEYLSKFVYDKDTFNLIKDCITTWNGIHANIIYVSKSGFLLAVIIDEDDKERILKYNFSGDIIDNSILVNDDYKELYVDNSIKSWINVSIDNEGCIISSKVFNSEDEALNNRSNSEFDTVMIRRLKK